jgi:putative addiction module component (TIGR02574 family)
VAEKLRLVTELWDDIGTSDEPLVLREWHQQEAGRRADELEENPGIAITQEELWRRVDESDG